MAANKRAPWTRRVKQEVESLRAENEKLRQANKVLAKRISTTNDLLKLAHERVDQLKHILEKSERSWWNRFVEWDTPS